MYVRYAGGGIFDALRENVEGGLRSWGDVSSLISCSFRHLPIEKVTKRCRNVPLAYARALLINRVDSLSDSST